MNKSEQNIVKDIDETDKRLLQIMSENSRLSYRQIAKRAGISVATVMHRINNLEEYGVIKGYTARLDYEKLGYDIEVIIEIRISKGRLFEVERRIATNPSVFAVYDTTGPFDATVLARFKTRRQMDGFLKKLQTFDFVERTETRLVLNTIKDNAAMS